MDAYTISTESVHYTAFRVSNRIYRITISGSLPVVIKMLSIQSLLNKSKSSIILSMLEKILLFLEQGMSIMLLWLIKSVVDLDQHQRPEFLRCPIQIDLISLLLSCINEMIRSLTLPFLWLLKHLAGTILISSPWTTSRELLESTDAINSLENILTPHIFNTTLSIHISATTQIWSSTNHSISLTLMLDYSAILSMEMKCTPKKWQLLRKTKCLFMLNT